jgi:hypothetical protein
MSSEYVMVDPRTPLPGCLVVLAKRERLDDLKAIQERRERIRYVATAHVSDQIPLGGGLDEVMASRPSRFARITENPQTIYLHQGGRSAVFFDLYPNADGVLTHIDVEVEATLPSNALAAARTALNRLLDTL